MPAYYNEIDPFASKWLKQLIKNGHIADGDVDSRSIKDVSPDDLYGYTQCHFFAGIGVWSYALRQARWPDDRPVWTGSCPCQPFSAAGKGKGKEDERHLWPTWFGLIKKCHPPVVFGEQVAAAIGHGWLDSLQSDMEGENYAIGKAILGACSVGAPHIRQRLYFVGVGLADTNEEQCGGRSDCELLANGKTTQRHEGNSESQPDCEAGVAQGDTSDSRLQRHGGLAFLNDAEGREDEERYSPTSGFWRDADWLHCKDGKYRCVEPGTFPLAHGVTSRVGRLRGYGNAIVAPVATEFIRSYMDLER